MHRNFLYIFAIISYAAFLQVAYGKCIGIFYLPSCPHCEQALSFFYNISPTYNITLHEYNVENMSVLPIFTNLSKYYNSGGGVPLILIGNLAFLGFAYGNGSQQINNNLSIGYSGQLLQAINQANDSCPAILQNSCKNCYKVVTPSDAKLIQEKSSANSITLYIVLALLIFIAVYIAFKKIRRI
ncbi:MAG: hypothetical protein ACPLYE_00410 [Candidatus Micrarchaeales archaeon]